MAKTTDDIPGYDRSYNAAWAQIHGWLRNDVVPRLTRVENKLDELLERPSKTTITTTATTTDPAETEDGR